MNKKSPTLTMDMVCILHLCATPFVLGGRKNAKGYTYGSSIKTPPAKSLLSNLSSSKLGNPLLQINSSMSLFCFCLVWGFFFLHLID